MSDGKNVTHLPWERVSALGKGCRVKVKGVRGEVGRVTLQAVIASVIGSLEWLGRASGHLAFSPSSRVSRKQERVPKQGRAPWKGCGPP